MPSWNELLAQVGGQEEAERPAWLLAEMTKTLQRVGALRAGDGGAPRNVLMYASAFLQKGAAPGEHLMITSEDINGYMTVIHGMDCSRGLTLLLHTPGGVTNAAETVVAYLRSKFDDVEVVVPALAMSAGTMIALGADRIVMGRQSQLGPIDPQIGVAPGRTVSARAVVEQFERARKEVAKDQTMAHVWAPIVASLGPALLQEAQNSLDYSESMVAKWVAGWMLKDEADADKAGRAVARHFNDASTHKSHGRRIDRDEARERRVVVEDLEASQGVQEAVLTAYHLMTILFEQTSFTKILGSDVGKNWIKNWN
ncbi:serine protease [Cellulosimicrobium sp. SL-1]|uniref:SDH family Clp fold serine proteinase n=1 Tax=Cellulosimicrobium sp. SL-1 TaxID=2699423 RepID=UPI0013D49484|nr:serine protease [Cellulosimicrobium sp. SL-1]